MKMNENFFELVENEVLLDYVNDKKKEFWEQYEDFSFEEYLKDVYCYSIEHDDINNLDFIGRDLINEFNCSLLEDKTFLTFSVVSHFRESKRKEIFGLSFNHEFRLMGEKVSTTWYALVVYPRGRNFDLMLYEYKKGQAVLDSDFVGKPLSYLIEHLRKENRI